MKKSINEASAKLELTDFSTDDLNALSQILQLAGQAENKECCDEPQVGIEPDGMENDYDVPMEVPEEEPEIGMDNPEESPIFEPEEEQDQDDELGDLMHMIELSKGTGQNMQESQILPELDMSQKEEFGPFRNEAECVANAQQETNGVENEHFVVVPRNNQFYWQRVMNEDIEEFIFDDDGIQNSVHGIDDKKNRIGDNALEEDYTQASTAEADAIDDCDVADSEDEVCESTNAEEIFESITARFNKFMQ